MLPPSPALALLLLSTLACAQTQTPTPAPTTQVPTAQTSATPATADQTPATDEPITTLKVSTRVVEISAVVTGKDGEPRGGLTRDDFILKEDGKDEPIRYFSQGSDLPLTLALIVDTSGSQRTFINDESLASDVFFETMLSRPDDRAMLVQIDSRVLELQHMTSSADRLHLALSRLGSTPATANGTLLDDAVYTIAKGPLASETGRKAMILLTDGGDNGSRTPLAEAIAQAERGNIQIYSIRYSAWNGLAGGPSSPALSRSAPVDPGLTILQKLSDATGGRVFTVSPGLGLRAIFAQIADDLRLQYEVGYTPPPDLPPNSYHRLDLRAKDRKLNVQARKGFFAQP